MTKIKNTKKGMAKKTLSMSLVVAMLATSNVPVWAAEFSDGSDVAVATEAPAEFADETEAPVVEDATEVAPAEATTTGVGYDITASAFSGVDNGEVKWGTPVSSTVTVTPKADATQGAELYYVWKDANGQIGTATPFGSKNYTATANITPDAALSNKQISLFVYAKAADGTVVWTWNSDAFTVKPIDINTVVTTKPTLKSTFGTTYTGKAIVPTVDDIDFTNLPKGFSKDDFVIGSTEGDTVNVTDDGVNVYLSVNKTGYTGSLVINYKIEKLELNSTNVNEFVTAAFATTTKPYTGNAIALKASDIKLKDKKSGIDLSAYVNSVDTIAEGDAKAGKQFNTGKAGDKTISIHLVTPTTTKNYTIVKGGLSITTSNSFAITKRNLNTVNVVIPEMPYQNGNPVVVGSSQAKYYDKATNEELKIADQVTITSTASTQGVHDVTVAANINSTDVEGSTTAKLSISASSLSTAKFTGEAYAEQAEEYTGAQITKDLSKLGSVKITDKNGDRILVKDKDYKVEFGTNINAGTKVGVITIVGLGSYEGSTKTVKFTINPAVVSKDSISINQYVEKKETTKASDYKDALGFVVKAKNAAGKEFTLTEGTDYVVNKYDFADSNKKVTVTLDTKAGTIDNASVNFLKNTNYIVKDDSANGTYSSTITDRILKADNIKLKKTSYTYTGAAIQPEFDVVVDGRVIAPTRYTVKSLTKNVNAGTATMVITGIKGQGFSSDVDATVNFTITAADAANVKAAIPSEGYTGYSIQPNVTTVTLNDVPVSVKDNFSVTYGENVKIGEGTVVLTPKNGNFTGTKTLTFKITGQMLNGGALKYYDANGLTTTLAHTYDGTAYAPAKTIFDASNTTLNTKTAALKLTEGTDYEIKYVDNVYGKAVGNDQKGIVLVIAKGTYAGDYTGNGVTSGIYTDAAGVKYENVIYAEQFNIGRKDVTRANIAVSNGVYAGGLPVKPVVSVNVNGKDLVEGTDYKLDYTSATNVTTTKSLSVEIVPINGYVAATNANLVFNWGIDKFDLANADVTVDGDKITVKCGRVDVEASEYTVEKKDGKATITANKTSKNYKGSKTVNAATEIGAPVISGVTVVGNKATVILSGDVDGASGYDYVISKANDTTNARVDVTKNQAKTTGDFTYVQQGTYYAYCHAWTRNAEGKKVFGEWSNIYPFSVSAITPAQPVITSVKAKGTTVTVTYTKAANAEGYDVVLGSAAKKVNGEYRPVSYGKLVKKNIKGNVVTATFKNVKKGTYYAGLHAFNKTSEDGKKVFSQWSNVKKVTVK